VNLIVGFKMTFKRLEAFCIVVAFFTLVTDPAAAQYPRVPEDVQQAAEKKMRDSDRHSDAAWEQAQPIVKEWEAKGKPYIPWAAKPSDLPQAPLPAFPGAEGGGMYSFGRGA
jgi:hypothetical protein